jgi:signal transduction histidine kinase
VPEHPRLTDRVVAALARDHTAAPYDLRRDATFAAGVLALQCAIAALLPQDNGHRPDALGWALLVVTALALVVRRRAPMTGMLVVIAAVAPYHALDNLHLAVVPASLVGVYSLAVAGPPLRTYLTVASVIGIMAAVMSATPLEHAAGDMLRSGGWVLAVALIGEAARIHRKYVAAIVERADRAERTREEEAARRVAEERLRIARDLHDLLAHSITLIGVQTSVAAHVLLADPDRLDRKAVSEALDGIAGTCRDARAELRATLDVLRTPDGHGSDDADGPLPGLPSLPDLMAAARGAGLSVSLDVPAEPGAVVPAAVGAAAYRIVQEALTNVVKHARATRVDVRVGRTDDALHVSVTDDGTNDASQDSSGDGAAAAPGYGLVGMRERVRSVGGTLRTGPHPGGGYAVSAVLPVGGPR